MAEEAGFQIGKKLYPFPQRFRLGDTVLIEHVTERTWPEFVNRLPDENAEGIDDPIALLGMLAIAVSQGNPTWRRDRVARYVSELAMEDVEIIGGSTDEEDDADPPLVTENGVATSSPSPQLSKSEPAPVSAQSSPRDSGTLTSRTSPKE